MQLRLCIRVSAVHVLNMFQLDSVSSEFFQSFQKDLPGELHYTFEHAQPIQGSWLGSGELDQVKNLMGIIDMWSNVSWAACMYHHAYCKWTGSCVLYYSTPVLKVVYRALTHLYKCWFELCSNCNSERDQTFPIQKSFLLLYKCPFILA